MKNTSLNELVYELMTLRRQQIKSTDELDRRVFIDWIQSMRARLLEQDFNKPFTIIDNGYVQDLTNNGTAVEMTTVSSNDVGIADNEYLLRTAIEIPKTIPRKGGIGSFVRIGPANKLSEKFNIVTPDRALVSGAGKFNYHTVYAFVMGDYIYLYSRSGKHLTIKYIDIRGVFQNPIEAALINDTTWTYDDDYPVTKSMIDTMKELIVKSKFNFVIAPLGDKVEDQEVNPEQNVDIQKR